jgi:Protein of unknown function (DUF2786)
MSRNSRRRRASRQRNQLHNHAAHARGEAPRQSTYDLIRTGIACSAGRGADSPVLSGVITQLIRRETVSAAAVASDIGLFLDHSIDQVFSRGWQPAEVVHVLRREHGTSPTRLVTALVHVHAQRTSAHTTAPSAWTGQLDELECSTSASGAEAFRHWRLTEDHSASDGWAAVLTMIGFVNRLGRLAPLIPVPAEWGATVPTPSDKPESKVLNTIRGLLAKAESTSYAAEAEALSAKAQDLMTRYAIDNAVIDAREQTSLTDQVSSRRLLIDNPYPEAKSSLLQAVSRVNGVRSIWLKDYGLITIVGMPVDLDLCDLLFTSLLVQSSRALTEAGADADSRIRSFRRSFLLAYAARIGERLAQARERASRAASGDYGTALVPIMAERTEAVGTVFDTLFPATTPVKHTITNTRGWVAGRVAADTADLTGGREKIDRW